MERQAQVRCDPVFMAEVRLMPCCSPALHHGGPIDPHHAGKRSGANVKADDDTCIPLCRVCHGYVDTKAGCFATWTWDELRLWVELQIERTRAKVLARLASSGEIPF